MSRVENIDMDTTVSPTSPVSSPKALNGSIEGHPQYHFYDGSLTFELEGLHYRVHGSLLSRHCSFTSSWAEDIRDPVGAGITREDLDAFLSMIYLSTYEAVDLDMPVDTWISVLRLATKWKAEGMRCLAIKMLTSLATAMDKLLLCRAYEIPTWLEPACAALALRPAPLTIAEAEIMERGDIIRIFAAREAIYRNQVVATDGAVSVWLSELSRIAPSEPANAIANAPPIPPPESAPAFLSTSPNPASSRTAVSLVSHKFASTDDGPADSHRTDSTDEYSAGTSTTGESPGVSEDNCSQRPANYAPAATLPPHIHKAVTDALQAIRAKRYDTAASCVTMKNVDSIAQSLASESFCQRGPPSMESMAALQGLLRAILRRGFRQPDFIPAGARFLFVISKNVGIPLMTVLSDDLHSVSVGWGVYKAGGTPAVDSGRLMGDIQNGFTREMYSVQISHGKGLLRSLVRLEVLPATNEWVGLLIK